MLAETTDAAESSCENIYRSIGQIPETLKPDAALLRDADFLRFRIPTELCISDHTPWVVA